MRTQKLDRGGPCPGSLGCLVAEPGTMLPAQNLFLTLLLIAGPVEFSRSSNLSAQQVYPRGWSQSLWISPHPGQGDVLDSNDS